MEDIARAVASWPVVALAIALFFCFLFRQQIAERLGATTKMSVAGLKVKFAQSIKISFQNFDIRRQIPSPDPGAL